MFHDIVTSPEVRPVMSCSALQIRTLQPGFWHTKLVMQLQGATS